MRKKDNPHPHRAPRLVAQRKQFLISIARFSKWRDSTHKSVQGKCSCRNTIFHQRNDEASATIAMDATCDSRVIRCSNCFVHDVTLVPDSRLSKAEHVRSKLAVEKWCHRVESNDMKNQTSHHIACTSNAVSEAKKRTQMKICVCVQDVRLGMALLRSVPLFFFFIAEACSTVRRKNSAEHYGSRSFC